jgi:ATP-dependent 26S proteasome regulatory subunit
VRPPRSVLLYGVAGTGKSALAHAVAHEAGAGVFNLSPRATDGKYMGADTALMVHMVR